VRSLAAQIEARLSARSSPGRGTSIRIEFTL
jgi:hypothetical protein